MLLGDILRRNAKLYPDKTAIIFKEKGISYADIENRVMRLSNGLTERGIRRGDRIGLISHPSSQFIELYIAIPKLGAVLVPLNCRLSGRELEYIINDADVKMLVMAEEFADTINSIITNLNTVESLYCIGKPPSGMESYENLISESSYEVEDLVVEDDDVAVQMYTSGTTGRPKGAMLTHKNLMSNHIGRVIDLKFNVSDIFLSCIPYYHVAAEYPLIVLYIGGTLIIQEKFDPAGFLKAVAKEKPTVILLVPAMVNFVIDYIDKHPGIYDFSSVRIFLYGASPMPVALLKKAIKIFKCDFFQAYGLTEASPGVTYLRPEDHILEGNEDEVRRLASCGKEVFNVEVRVVNDSGMDVKPDEMGEIIVKGDNIMKGYWKLPDETALAIRNGWLYTGDMGTVDKGGFVFIVDRKKDMIISGAENIYPREVEEVLYANPSILEAAVIGVPDEKWGESVKAFVVLKEGESASEKEIIDFCKDNISSYKKPKSVEFLKSLPRNPTGKVLKKELRKKDWDGYDRDVS